MKAKFYWCHQESESIGSCDTEEELHKHMETPLVEQLDKKEFDELKAAGWEE